MDGDANSAGNLTMIEPQASRLCCASTAPLTPARPP
jgi:hypothetical protein